MRTHLFPALLSACALALPASAGVTGKPLPECDLDDFTQTEAKSLEDLTGRLVLIEFFAYW